MLSKHSCQNCRLSKSKCDRATQGCARCERAGYQCVYAAPDKSLRIRNQTVAAERHAIRAWRARAKDAPTRPSQALVKSRSNTPLEPPLATDVETLARHRFIYDFSEGKILALSLCRDFSTEQSPLPVANISGKSGQRQREGVEVAFVATSLANFYKRNHDSRAASLATCALGKALSILADSLRSSQTTVSHNMVLMAVLLGLHQNINPDQHLVGSWVHHFRGSVHLIDAVSQHGLPELAFSDLAQLVEKQALCVSLRVQVPFPVSAAMRKNLDSKQDLRSRALALGASVADYSSRALKTKCNLAHGEQLEIFESWQSIDARFDQLESNLRLTLPYDTSPTNEHTYPLWYQEISAKPGGPSKVHSYKSEDAVAIWNSTRMARMKLLAVVLDLKLFQSNDVAKAFSRDEHHAGTEHALVTHVVSLVEDLCASVFYRLSHRSDGLPPVSSFEDVAGARGYALMSPLALAADCLQQLPNPNDHVEMVEWIEHVLMVMRDRLGVSESWCWRDGDKEVAISQIERTLRFDRED